MERRQSLIVTGVHRRESISRGIQAAFSLRAFQTGCIRSMAERFGSAGGGERLNHCQNGDHRRSVAIDGSALAFGLRNDKVSSREQG